MRTGFGLAVGAACFFGVLSASAQDATKSRDLRIDLIDRFPVARSDFDVRNTASLDIGDDILFSGGWYAVDEQSGGRWSESRAAVIDVARSKREEFLLKIRLTPPPANEQLDPQKLRLHWNGSDLGSFDLAPGVGLLEVPVPASLQRLGPNRLTLSPSYMVWTDEPAATPATRRRVGVRLDALDFGDSGSNASGPRPARLRNRIIEQRLGSILTYALEIPEGARLRGAASVGAGLSEQERTGGGLKIVVTTKGGQWIVWQRSLQELVGKKASFDIDLGNWQGEAAHVSFLADAGDLWGPGIAGIWAGLEIVGQHQGPPAPVSLALEDGYNVLIVLFDTLRADQTEPYGAPDGTTPGISALASEGVTFDNAIAPSSWTRSSVASMLTGVLPSVHGTLDKSHSLGPRIAVLPEILKDADYTTTLVTGNLHLGKQFGFGRGFDEVHESFTDYRRVRRRYPSAVERADFYWEKYFQPILPEKTGRPFFLYLHELDPHSPYEPLPPYADDLKEAYVGDLDDRHVVARGYRFGLIDLEPADVDHMKRLYNGEVRYMDRFLARLLAQLQKSGVRDQTLIVFVSDHGEEFGEHRGLGHGATLFEESIRVPMIWSLPGVLPEGERSAQPASLVDVTPTVLELLGLPFPVVTQGQSLLGAMLDPRAEDPQKNLVAILKDSHDSLRSGRWKLIREGVQSDSFRLYDLERDPEERLDRWATHPIQGSVLKQELLWQRVEDSALRALQPPVPVSEELDPDTAAQLRALGYR